MTGNYIITRIIFQGYQCIAAIYYLATNLLCMTMMPPPDSSVMHYNISQNLAKSIRSIIIAKEFDRLANELDFLIVEENTLLQTIKDCTDKERSLVVGFEQDFSGAIFDNVANARLKHVKKEIKHGRAARKKALEELIEIKSKVAKVKARIEMESFKQGDIYFDFRIDAVAKY